MMRCLSFISLLILAVLSGSLSALGATCVERKGGELNKLEKVYVYKGIRVFWTEQAPRSGRDHRLPQQSAVDRNNNGIPDLIENIARQADASRRAYVTAGFPDPLDAPRYRGVQFIDINVLKMKYNGLAYDAPLAYPGAPGRGTACTLRIDISSGLETGLRGPVDKRVQPVFTKHWFVVGHEMFHLFQYGLTQFKRAWINEPTAKWAEYALRRGSLYENRMEKYSLPGSLRSLQADVIDAPTSPTANLFWSKLIQLCGNSPRFQVLPKSLLEETYTDGEPIFKDSLWEGMAFIQNVYRGLQNEDQALPSQYGRDALNWPEKHQISSEYDARLIMLIQNAVRNCGAINSDNNVFLRID